jgi:hypothetical protein
MNPAAAVNAVQTAVGALAKVTWDTDDATRLREHLKQLKTTESKLAAQLGRLTHAADAAGAFIGTGSCDTAEWLGKSTGTSTTKNRTAAELGEAMSKSEELADAVQSGRISTDKANATVGAAGGSIVDRGLIDEIADLPLPAVRPAVEDWRARNNPTRDEDVASSQRSRRFLKMRTQRDGMSRLDGLLDPESGAIVRSVLDGIMNQTAPDKATRDQRCADALTQLCKAASKGKVKGGRSNTKLLATAPFETITERGIARGHTHVGTTLDAATIRKMACDAGIHRVITGPGSSILDFGHETRVVPENLYLALVARDEHCRWPGCNIRASWCDAHHIIHWADDGPTNDDNCVLLCHRHHQLSHQPGWMITGNGQALEIHHPDGTIEVSRPPGATTPRAAAVEVSKPPGASTPRAGETGHEPPASHACAADGDLHDAADGTLQGDEHGSNLHTEHEQLTLA